MERRCLYGTGQTPQIGWDEEVRTSSHCRDAACDLAPSVWRPSCCLGRRDSARGFSEPTLGGHDGGHRDDDNVADDYHQHNDNHHDDQHDHCNNSNHHNNPHDPDYNNHHHVAATDHEPGAEASPEGARRPEALIPLEEAPAASPDEAAARLPVLAIPLPPDWWRAHTGSAR